MIHTSQGIDAVFSFLHRGTSLEFMHAMDPVARKILSCFATGLGFPADFFEKVGCFAVVAC